MINQSLTADMLSWRHRLHAHPETAFEEVATADLIAGLLKSWGLDVHRGLAQTGVVGTLRAGNSPRAIGLRADMDALHIHEANDFAHCSTIQGKMHACGHDGHMAMLLGAARHLSDQRDFDGTIHFIFQPAEENEAGAKVMVEEGLFDLFPVDLVFGMHNIPMMPEGQIGVLAGPAMASADFFEIVLTGRGAHAGWPHQGTDLISTAAHLVQTFNHLTSRAIDTLEPAVVSVTKIHGGHATNVMPDRIELAGTVRTLDPTVQDKIADDLAALVRSVAGTFGAEYTMDYQRRYPVLVNDPEAVALAERVAASTFGPKNVTRPKRPLMVSEDFAWMLRRQKGCYLWIGNGAVERGGQMLHHPAYDFNDALLPIGCEYWVRLACAALDSDISFSVSSGSPTTRS